SVTRCEEVVHSPLPAELRRVGEDAKEWIGIAEGVPVPGQFAKFLEIHSANLSPSRLKGASASLAGAFSGGGKVRTTFCLTCRTERENDHAARDHFSVDFH